VNAATPGRDGVIVFKIREPFATHSVERRMVDESSTGLFVSDIRPGRRGVFPFSRIRAVNKF
jgi:hypothetical protein